MRVSLLAAIAAVSLAATVPAPAHERRPVGRVETVVGWLSEPAYAGSLNGVSFRATRDGAGVTGASLKVDVTFPGAETLTLQLEPAFRDPGHYEAAVIPTRPGAYSFRIYGRLAGASFNQSYRSGADTFDDIAAPADIEYPEKDPSRDQLAARAEAQEARIARVTSAAADARDSANLARILALVAIVLGAGAFIVALRGRRGGAA